ncbi:MAG: HAD-IIB family hydrolase [Phycisphaeraceae bacterium]|nr:HAD-IIB family hydrolase [Phycisphaeraceae bacterium]MCW5762684.1 HAD-IIB family hydrolase [Phycisphaeraceae bacterium]
MPPGPAYDILALDLDGTLLAPDGTVSQPNRDAVRAARAAGIAILPCTGRGFNECRHVLAAIEHTGPVAVAGGAMLVDAASGTTLHRFAMNPAIVARAAEAIVAAGHAALVHKDRHAAGYDYLVVNGHDQRALDPVSVWWFETLRITTRTVATLEGDEHPQLSVRVGLVADAADSLRLMMTLREQLDQSAIMHSFAAVVGSGTRRDVHVLEIFDARAHKWSAVEWFIADIAARMPTAPARNGSGPRVAAIGDHINDLTMLRAADLGIAMGNADPAARDAADVVTLSNTDDGVAHAIGQILTGAW